MSSSRMQQCWRHLISRLADVSMRLMLRRKALDQPEDVVSTVRETADWAMRAGNAKFDNRIMIVLKSS